MNAQRLGLALLLVGLLFAPALPNRLLAAPLSASAANLDTQLDPAWTFARQQLLATANRLSSTQFPNYTSTSGAWVTTDAKGWTSGFFPGSLWLADEQYSDPALRSAAEKWTAALEGQKNRTDTHDVGFIIFNSFGNAYRRTGNDAYRQVLLTAAASLATRYDPDVGCIKSWDGDEFRVLIDNMMNLELLFWAARNGGKHEWYDMAVSHALKTRANHVRADGSTYQIVIYDPASGAVKSKVTHQGYNSESTWSRGQSWAIYGFSMAYRETGDVRFHDTARAAADYFLANLPADHVPYWDFELPSVSGEPRDSSAAAAAAAGLLELSTLVGDATASQNYRAQAAAILASLTGPSYLAKGTSNQAILLHGTPNKNQDRYDRGTSYGDYYLLQALLRYQATTPPTVTPATPTVTPTPTTPTVTPAYALRLNAGGSKQTLSGVEWRADSSYSGGSVYEVAGAAIGGTSADVLYQSERNGTSFSYAIALPASGSYRVRLHFAELYWTSAGKRVFSVNLEGGTPELSNYDIYAAVGYRTATVKEYSVAVNDGKLDISFSASTNRAKISAIEVLSTTPPTVTPATPTVTPTPTTPTVTPAYALRLNAGGSKQTLSGVEWQADSSYSGGSVYEVAGAAIGGTSADVLYQSERNGTSFSYAIALPASGSYRVRLHFAELYWTSAGKRVFSVNLEGGTPELSNYDIYAAVGYRTATVKEYSVAVSDGKLDISFSASTNRAKISAIEVLR